MIFSNDHDAIIAVSKLDSLFQVARQHDVVLFYVIAADKYDVYQILVGDLSDGKLSNVEWGSSVNTPTEGKINGKTAGPTPGKEPPNILPSAHSAPDLEPQMKLL